MKEKVAANAGYDPAPTGSKPVVLPLHQSAINALTAPTNLPRVERKASRR